MKIFLFVLLLSVMAPAFVNFTVPNAFVDSAVITATSFNQDFDSTAAAINRNKDTTEIKFIRFYDLEHGDSTLDRLNVDTLDSNPYMDSISGNPWIDSVSVITGIRGRLTTGNANINTGTGDITTDSIYGRVVKSDTIKTNGLFIIKGTDSVKIRQDVAGQLEIISPAALGLKPAGAQVNVYGDLDVTYLTVDGIRIGTNGTTYIDSVKVTTGGGHDTLKIWNGTKLFKVTN